MKQFHYFAVYKPYDMLTQFSGESGDALLGDLFNFPKDVYPIGRLDKDSEGLLLLTNDNQLKTHLLDPTNKIPKTYLVQVDGDITPEALLQLESGTIEIKHNGKPHKVQPAKCKKIDDPSELPERSSPVRFRKNIPTSWIELCITEGKNRQVRKMTAAVGFPTLRLIRVQIGSYKLKEFKPEMVWEIESGMMV